MPASVPDHDRALGAAGRSAFAAALFVIVAIGAVLAVRYGDVVTPLLGALR
jgi:hypothetical protein